MPQRTGNPPDQTTAATSAVDLCGKHLAAVQTELAGEGSALDEAYCEGPA